MSAAELRVLRTLELSVRRRLDGLLQGDHAGLRTGPGSEPDETRGYRPGQDDVRRMDWNVTARTGAPHVRAALAEHELEAWVLVDASASMDFGTADMEKRDLAAAVVAAVGFLTDRPGNRLGARVLAGGELRRLPARQGRLGAHLLLRELLAVPRAEPGPAASGDLASAIDRMRREHRRSGLRVVVSDFLPAEPAQPSWQQPLRRLAARHEVIAVEVVDPRELELPDVGLLTLIDPETGQRREVQTASRRLRQRYAQVSGEHREATRVALRRAGAAHVVLRTDRDWVGDLARFVIARRKQARRSTFVTGSVRP